MKLVNFGHVFIERYIYNIFYLEKLEYFLHYESSLIA